MTNEIINDTYEAERLFRQIRQDMETLFGFRLKYTMRVKLTPPDYLTRLMRKPPDSKVYGLCCRAPGDTVIYIELGLSLPCFYVTLCHEYAHVWQAEEGYSGAEADREMHAELVAMVLAQKAGFDFAEEFLYKNARPDNNQLDAFAALAKFAHKESPQEKSRRQLLQLAERRKIRK